MDRDCNCVICKYPRGEVSAEYKDLVDMVDFLQKENAELKAHLKAVDEVNEKMKCCGNCKDELKQYDRGGCPDCVDLSKWELAK